MHIPNTKADNRLARINCAVSYLNSTTSPAFRVSVADTTIHPPGTTFRGVRSPQASPRPWLEHLPTCTALQPYHVLHAGTAVAPPGYRIVRTRQTSGFFLATLGYANGFILSKAFLRWSGQRPSEFRRMAPRREGDPAPIKAATGRSPASHAAGNTASPFPAESEL